MNTKEINFVCPDCGNTVLSAALKVKEYVNISYYEEDYFEVGNLLDSFVEDGPFAFQCHKCGLLIGETEGEAYEWLDRHAMLDEEVNG
jgi:predicted RNA-binding Zn-ribbon protein involved in translation (DUF1610 family)